MNSVPVFFKAWIGGFVGPSYELELVDGELHYRVFERGYEMHKNEVLTPNDNDWRRFLSQVDAVSLWQWEPVYQGQPAPDGTTWFVHLEDGTRTIESKGLNLYPPLFTDYLRAVRALTGGRHFA
ncbi:MAG: hypothetical protein ACOCYQ_00875 [Alkalispirochaeta sp.]